VEVSAKTESVISTGLHYQYYVSWGRSFIFDQIIKLLILTYRFVEDEYRSKRCRYPCI